MFKRGKRTANPTVEGLIVTNASQGSPKWISTLAKYSDRNALRQRESHLRKMTLEEGNVRCMFTDRKDPTYVKLGVVLLRSTNYDEQDSELDGTIICTRDDRTLLVGRGIPRPYYFTPQDDKFLELKDSKVMPAMPGYFVYLWSIPPTEEESRQGVTHRIFLSVEDICVTSSYRETQMDVNTSYEIENLLLKEGFDPKVPFFGVYTLYVYTRSRERVVWANKDFYYTPSIDVSNTFVLLFDHTGLPPLPIPKYPVSDMEFTPEILRTLTVDPDSNTISDETVTDETISTILSNGNNFAFGILVLKGRKIYRMQSRFGAKCLL